MKRAISLVVAVVLMTAVSVSAKDKIGTTMSAPEAQNWVDANVNPIILDYANHDRGVPTLRQYILSIAVAAEKQQVALIAAPQYGSNPRALMESDDSTGKWRVYLLALALRDLKSKLNDQDFRDAVAVSLAHEMRHIQIASLNLDRATEEAQVAGWTIVELIRPLAELGRKPFPELLQSSERLSIDYHDNYRDPRWVQVVVSAQR